MAKEAKPAEPATEAPKKSKKLLIIIVAALVLLLALGGGAAFFLMKNNAASEGDEDEEVAAENHKETKKHGAKDDVTPTYVAMDAFTVNLVPDTGGQYVQLILSIEVTDAKLGDKIKAQTPRIRNDIVMILSDKKASELLTKEGKEKLAGEIRDRMNQVLAPGAKAADGPVRGVLFTSFIIQ